MSAIAALYNVPSDQNELNVWAFAHASHHREINAAILALGGPVLLEVPLDPINPEAIQVWLAQHQEMHDQFEAVLNIGGYDLLDVDWQNPQELAGWILLNASVHQQAANGLGIG